MRWTLVGLAAVAVGLSSCAAMYTASPEEDAKAKALKPEPGRALVIVYRDSKTSEGRLVVNATLSSKDPAGKSAYLPGSRLDLKLRLYNDTYTVVDVPAGLVEIRAHEIRFNPFADIWKFLTFSSRDLLVRDTDPVSLSLKSGEIQYVELVAKTTYWVLVAQVDARLVSQSSESAMTALRRSRLLKAVRVESRGEASAGN